MNSITLLFAACLATAATFPPLHLLDRGRRDNPPKAEETARKDDTPKPTSKPKRVERAQRGEKEKDKPEEPPAGAYEVEVMRNIAYRDDKDADPTRHKLDIFLPKGQSEFPVFFFVHGGGWHSGNKEMYAPLGQLFARNGIGAVIINYRLAPQAKFPAHVEDVAKAFAWVHGNIAPEINRTWLGIVGPGVKKLGVEAEV